MSSNWSELQSDCLEVISSRIYSASLVDHIHAAAVCKPWRSVFKRESTHNLPLIMLRSSLSRDPHLCFNSIEGNVFHRFDHPNISFLDSCCGSGHGWLVMTDGDDQVYYNSSDDNSDDNSDDDLNIYPEYGKEIWLFNPITRTKISLPCLSTLRENDGVCVVQKAVISSQPTLENNGNNCFIAAIVYYPYDPHIENIFLIFCKPGDTKWIILKDCVKDHSLLDLAYCNGSFYALDRCIKLVVCDIGSSTPMVGPFVSVIETFGEQYHFGVNIIESGGELLLVKWYTNEYCEFLKFLVFRLEQDSHVWSEVKNLGGRSLFYSHSFVSGLKSSVSILACDNPGLKQNCIYFMSCDYKVRCVIFSLEDGSIQYIPQNVECPCLYGVWITPSFYSIDL